MKKLFTPWKGALAGGLGALALSSASTADNVVEVLSERPEFSTLVTAVTEAGLADDLAAAEDITLFAPDNDAFAEVPADVLAGLLADQEALTDLLFYHVAPEELRFRELRDGPLETLLDDQTVEVDVRSYFFGRYRVVRIDEARIVRADIRADNGVIHRINSVLDPSYMTKPSILDIAAGNPDFSILAGLVEEAGLAGVLDSEKAKLTVFAPPNAAFEALGEETLAAVAGDPELLLSVLKNHIALGVRDSEALADAGYVRTALRRNLPIESDPASPTGLTVDGKPILAADLHASNGVVHVVGEVLVPEEPRTLVDLALEREDLTTFVTAVSAAGLVDTFDQVQKWPAYTIFAPDNDAFSALPDGLLEELLGDPTGALAEVLKLHVVEGRFKAENLYDGQVLKSLSGGRLEVSVTEGEVRINGAPVAEPDLMAVNGVLHVMGGVIPAVPYTVADYVAGKPYLSTLLAALDAAGLVGAVDDPEADLTVFAPVNYAFDRLPDGTLGELLADPSGDLTQILLYHVLGESLSADELIDRESATTLQGADVEISSFSLRFWWWRTPFRIVRINDSQVIAADIETDNGMIHLLSGVLLPPDGEE